MVEVRLLIEVRLGEEARYSGVDGMVVASVVAVDGLLLDLVEEVYHFAHVKLVVYCLLDQVFEYRLRCCVFDFDQMLKFFYFVFCW